MTVLTILIFFLTLLLQSPSLPDPIAAENFTQLAPVSQIDFANLPADFTNGWFAINSDATRLLVSDRDGVVYLLDDLGNVLRVIPVPAGEGSYPGSLIDATFVEDRVYLLRILDGVAYLNDDALTLPGAPISLWGKNGDTGDHVFIELMPSADQQPLIIEVLVTQETLTIINQIPYAPAQDPEAVVRVGRILPPYAVTSTLTGSVTIWDLEQSSALVSLENGLDEPAVFGNINLPPTHFVWRDNRNETLYLLDFETGDSRLIDALEGAYAQWFFLSEDANVILAVNLNFEPGVVAWDVQSRTRTVLGAYRSCDRPQPDAARFSIDGSALVIGCDTGLEIWRVP